MSLNNLSEENKIFVSKLFGIKAGLSMISLEVDKIRNAETIMRKYTDDIDNGENTLKRVNERVQGFSARVEEYKSYVSADNKRKVKKFISAGVWLTLGIVMVIAGIVGMVVGIVSDTAMVSTMSLISGLFARYFASIPRVLASTVATATIFSYPYSTESTVAAFL